MNAWPALSALHYDGWMLRYADGYTKRANSVYSLYPSETDLDEKIEFCESFFRDRGLPTVFKMTAASAPADLDTRLAMHGYRRDSQTSVQLLNLNAEKYEMSAGIELASQASETWHAAFARMNNVCRPRGDLSLIRCPCGFSGYSAGVLLVYNIGPFFQSQFFTQTLTS